MDWTWSAITFLFVLNVLGIYVGFVAGWRQGYKEGVWAQIRSDGPNWLSQSDIDKPSWGTSFIRWLL